MSRVKPIILLLCIVLLLAGCEGDILHDGVYIESVHITGTEDSAQITFGPNSLLETPQAGAIEYDGSGFYLTNWDYRRFISQASDSIITPITVSDSDIESTIYTAMLSANTLVPYRVYRVWFFGNFSTKSASDVVTIRIKANGSTLVTLTSTAGQVDLMPWHGWAVFTVRTEGTNGTISGYANAMLGPVDVQASTPSAAIDTTILNYQTVTAQWSKADPENILTLDQAYLEVLD